MCPRFDSWLLEEVTPEERRTSGPHGRIYSTGNESLRNPVMFVGVHRKCDYTHQDFLKLAEELGFEPAKKVYEVESCMLSEAIEPYNYPEESARKNMNQRGFYHTTFLGDMYPPFRPRSSNK